MHLFRRHLNLKKAPAYELAGVAVFLAAWFFLSAWVASSILPSPREVLAALIGNIENGEFLDRLAWTMSNVLASFCVGGAAGVAIGLIVGCSRIAELVFSPYLYALYALPKIAIIPLFVVWLGVGSMSIIVVAAIAVSLLVYINTVAGVKTVDPIFLRAAINLGARRNQIITKVVLPSASGLIFSGLRLGMGQALITVTAAEIVLSGFGIGAWMWEARYSMSGDIVFLCLFTLSALGTFLTWFVSWTDKKLFPWRFSRLSH